MDDAKRKSLAASVGLPEDATEEQINAKLRSIRAAADEAGAGDSLAGEDPNAGESGGEVAPGEDPNNDQTPPGTSPSGTEPSGDGSDVEAGTVQVDKATWEATQRGAALAAKHEAERVSTRQQSKVEAAIKAGKIPPARRDHYSKLMAMDEEGTSQVLDTLQASAVPLGEFGKLGEAEDGIEAGNGTGLPDEWFPDITQKREAVSAGRTSPITHAKEG
jgi:hypothetical protein